jgi:hypothetical protein
VPRDLLGTLPGGLAELRRGRSCRRPRTADLLELHAMCQSAISICLQLPPKYRTHLPQCADIFKHEIRLEALAKESTECSEQRPLDPRHSLDRFPLIGVSMGGTKLEETRGWRHENKRI